MDAIELQGRKERVLEGSMGDLTKIIEYLLAESQGRYNRAIDRYEYHQSRVNVFEEVLDLLPEASNEPPSRKKVSDEPFLV